MIDAFLNMLSSWGPVTISFAVFVIFTAALSLYKLRQQIICASSPAKATDLRALSVFAILLLITYVEIILIGIRESYRSIGFLLPIWSVMYFLPLLGLQEAIRKTQMLDRTLMRFCITFAAIGVPIFATELFWFKQPGISIAFGTIFVFASPLASLSFDYRMKALKRAEEQALNQSGDLRPH